MGWTIAQANVDGPNWVAYATLGLTALALLVDNGFAVRFWSLFRSRAEFDGTPRVGYGRVAKMSVGQRKAEQELKVRYAAVVWQPRLAFRLLWNLLHREHERLEGWPAVATFVQERDTATVPKNGSLTLQTLVPEHLGLPTWRFWTHRARQDPLTHRAIARRLFVLVQFEAYSRPLAKKVHVDLDRQVTPPRSTNSQPSSKSRTEE